MSKTLTGSMGKVIIVSDVSGRAACIGSWCRPREGRFYEDCPPGVRSRRAGCEVTGHSRNDPARVGRTVGRTARWRERDPARRKAAPNCMDPEALH
jgi:hypothetical protein